MQRKRFTVNQARPYLEVVHSFYDEGEPVGPVVASPSQKPDADGIAAGHQAVAVVWTRPADCRRVMAGTVQ